MRTLNGLLLDVIKSARKPGGMSDEALDWGETDEEAAENWDKENPKEETTKSANLSLNDFYTWATNTGFKKEKIDGNVFRQWATDVVGADPVEADQFWNENTSQNASLYREPNPNEAKHSPKEMAAAKMRASGAYSDRPKDLGNGMKTPAVTQVPHRDAAVQPAPVAPEKFIPGKDRAYSEVDSSPKTEKVTTYSGGTEMTEEKPVANPKEIYPKDTTFKSLFEAQAWKNPDPDRFVVRPTTTGERREYGARMRFIVDEVPHREPVGAFGNRRVLKSGDPTTGLGSRKDKLENPERYVHDKHPKDDETDENADVKKAADHNSGGGLSGAGGIYGKDYFDSHWGGGDDDAGEDDYSDETPVGKGPKSGASQKRDDEGTEKSLTEFVRKSYLALEILDSLDLSDEKRNIAMEAVKKSNFWEDKVIHREDKELAAKEAKPKEEKPKTASQKVREAVLSGKPMMKANVRDGESTPVTGASAKWVEGGGRVDAKTGKPLHEKKDETPNIKPERLHAVQEAKSGHDKEIESRNSKAQSYLDSKKAAWRRSGPNHNPNPDYDKADIQDRAAVERKAQDQMYKDEARLEQKAKKEAEQKAKNGWGRADDY